MQQEVEYSSYSMWSMINWLFKWFCSRTLFLYIMALCDILLSGRWKMLCIAEHFWFQNRFREMINFLLKWSIASKSRCQCNARPSNCNKAETRRQKSWTNVMSQCYSFFQDLKLSFHSSGALTNSEQKIVW